MYFCKSNLQYTSPAPIRSPAAKIFSLQMYFSASTPLTKCASAFLANTLSLNIYSIEMMKAYFKKYQMWWYEKTWPDQQKDKYI